MAENKKNTAVIFSKTEPTDEQKACFSAFLSEKYGNYTLVWQKDEKISKGFRLEVGSEVYDWTLSGRFSQLKHKLRNISDTSGNIISLIRETVDEWKPEAVPSEIGKVISAGDGIAILEGLENVTYGEIILFDSGVKGMVMDLSPKEVGCILFDGDETVCEGAKAKRTGKTAGIPVGEDFLGRVIDPLGNPIDGKGEIFANDFYPIEKKAPGIIERQPVNEPLKTGILSLDSMFPIGKGQRELIIGDRQTGKTSIAIDAILNQKDKNIICIYVAIGQKASSVANIVETLRKNNALQYTTVVSATAGDVAPLLYIAPYSATAIGEYFMNKGKDVLIIYDDLSKHAVAYRSLSLLLGRSPGREAYPGDVFYLHSRLLERSSHLSEENGGGSMTALPIVETQAGDVSAYIPTNIISITDGQIFLESDLFFAGQRPAVNIGLSVSRVGGNAQTKAMKKATGNIRLDLAQYREMEIFTQFSSDLDEKTKESIKYGKGLMMLLRQDKNSPLSEHSEVILLVSALAKIFTEIPEKEIPDFKKKLVSYFEENEKELCKIIDVTEKLEEETQKNIIAASEKFLDIYKRQV